MRSKSWNFTLLSNDVRKFLLSILPKKKKSITFRPHCDTDTLRASHQHLELNSAVESTKLFSPRQPTAFLVSLTVGEELTDYLAD